MSEQDPGFEDAPSGWLTARSHLLFLTGLALAFAFVILVEDYLGTLHPTGPTLLEELAEPQQRPARSALSADDMAMASKAWEYFEDFTQTDTGLANSVSSFPSTTLWDTGSYLLGMIAARQLDIIDTAEFDQRLVLALDSLARLPLVEDKLPNKAYDTRSLGMVDYANQPSEEGVGWSAIDIGRVLVPLSIVVWRYPEHAAAVHAVVNRWRLAAAVNQQGQLQGSRRDADGALELVQEGRLGYEEYAARAFQRLGYDVASALRYDDFLDFETVEETEIAVDTRSADLFGASVHMVSEPLLLDGLEYGGDLYSRAMADAMLAAQQQRWARTGLLTAVTEDHLDRPPYFIYSSVWVDGRVWGVVTPDGDPADEFRLLSAKAAIGWNGLYRSAYTKALRDAVLDLAAERGGWYAGRYEQDGETNLALTANTNGVILEAIAYKAFGPLAQLGDTGQ